MDEIRFDDILEELRKESLMEKYLNEMTLFKKHINDLGNFPKLKIMKNAREQKRVRDMIEDIFEDIDL